MRSTCKGHLTYCVQSPCVHNSIDIPKTFEAKGVTNAKDRLRFVVGDVREPFPEPAKSAAVDTLVMKHFLSAFSDTDARLIVHNCKQTLSADGKILLLQVCCTCA